MISGKTGSHRPTPESILKKVSYTSVLHLIREIEDQINNYSEIYTQMIEKSKGSVKVNLAFKKVIKDAEDERKIKKYFEQKEIDQKAREEKMAVMLKKMAEKLAVERLPGKIQMVRMNVPSHEKLVLAKKKVKTDWDMLKYFGEDIDWEELKN